MTTILLLATLALILWVWVAGWIAWGIHIHRKFKSCARVCSAELTICDSLNLYSVAGRVKHTTHLELAKHARRAMELAHQDFNKTPLWFVKLPRSRWNVDYFEAASHIDYAPLYHNLTQPD